MFNQRSNIFTLRFGLSRSLGSVGRGCEAILTKIPRGSRIVFLYSLFNNSPFGKTGTFVIRGSGHCNLVNNMGLTVLVRTCILERSNGPLTRIISVLRRANRCKVEHCRTNSSVSSKY